MNNKKSLLSRAVQTGLFAVSIFATSQTQALSLMEPAITDAPPMPLMDEIFLTSDMDSNQQLSIAEFYQLHAAAALIEYEMAFIRMDNDQSGDVDAEEFNRFVPFKEDAALTETFMAAAGEDGLMDVKEFTVMRNQSQDNSNSLMWKFAMMDRDHDGELNPGEFYGSQVTALPQPIDHPIYIEPIEIPVGPELPITILPIEPKPENPVTIQPVKPEQPEQPVTILPVKPEPEEPEQPILIDPITPEEPTQSGMPAEPDQALMAKIASLTDKLANLGVRMERIEKSIIRTQERIQTTEKENRIKRLERRLERQSKRMTQALEKYEATLQALDAAKQLLES